MLKMNRISHNIIQMDSSQGLVKHAKNFFIGLVSAFLSQPFEVLRTSSIKSKLSSQQLGVRSFVGLYQNILRVEGYRGLFKGTMYAIAKNGVSSIVFFSSLELMSGRIKSLFNLNSQNKIKNKINYFLQGTLIAGASKVFSVFITTPIILLKTHREIAGQTRSLGQVMKNIHKNSGITGFFRGFILLLLRDVPWSGLQFSFYRIFLRTHQNYISKEVKSSGSIFVYGAFSSCLATLIVYPFDNLRVRIQTSQTNEKSLLKIGRQVLKLQGVSGFYKGVEARLLKKSLSGGALWVLYKWVWKKDDIQY